MSIKPEAKAEAKAEGTFHRPIIATTAEIPPYVQYYHRLAHSGDGDAYSESQKIVTFYPQPWEADNLELGEVEKIYLVYRGRD